MAEFTYMGTKRLLAPRIAELVRTMPAGPFLDLFSGIAAVGAEVGTERPIWCNDVQQFSTLLTRRKFTSAKAFVAQDGLVSAAAPLFDENCDALTSVFSALLEKEKAALHTTSTSVLSDLISQFKMIGGIEQNRLRGGGHHCLFSTTHAGTYFGLGQAIEIDSIRSAADRMLQVGRIGKEDHEWMILALCQAIMSSSNSTGHFAQYLSPNAGNIHRILRKRRRSIWHVWQDALRSLRPMGPVRWRRGNKVFNMDAVRLLHMLDGKSRRPSVIYADPPYTSDQYSRYYHVLENLVLYDYPKIAGKGQYRQDRFTSGFSLKSAASRSFEELIEAASKIDATLILSYPTNGLLGQSTEKVLEILKSCFSHVETPIVVPHMHSTMGGSKGSQKQAVDENIFVASQRLEIRRRGIAHARKARNTRRSGQLGSTVKQTRSAGRPRKRTRHD